MEPVIEDLYISTGMATFEYRDYAFLSEGSVLAAEAASCANDQGMFWEMHDMIFYNVDNPQLPGLNRPTFDLIASYLELDMDAFTACMDNHTHRDAVIASREEGSELGVNGTPTILLNGEIVTDIETYNDLFQMIEAAAAGS